MPRVEARLIDVGDEKMMGSESPNEVDELEQLLHQIEVDVTVNGSTEFIEVEQQPTPSLKHDPPDKAPPDKASPSVMKIVDSQENPTQLYLRINYRLWDMAAKVLHQNPSEASTWIEQSSSDNAKKIISRNLPLHLLCQQGPNPAPVVLVNKLLAAYPQAIQTRNSDGDLPIHIACRNPAFRGMEGASVLMTLAEVYPKSMEAKSGDDGPTPWTILETHHGAMSPHGATISKMLQVKLGVNRPRPLSRPRVRRAAKSPSRAPPELITKEGSDIASELNRRRLSVLMNDGKGVELSPLSQEKADLSSGTFKGQESRDEESNHETLPLHVNADITPSATNHANSFDNGGWRNRNPSSVREGKTDQHALKQSRTLQDIDLLKRKLDDLREENFSNEVKRREMEATIEVLRKSVDQERDACRLQIKAAEAQITSLQDQLLLAQEKMSSKSKSEQELFKRVLHLESILAEKKAELATMKASIQELGSSKAVLQQALQLRKEKLGVLQDELHVKNQEISCLIDKNESNRKEASKLIEILAAAQNKASELEQSIEEKDRAIDERDIQIRALTEARRASEKRIEELEDSNVSLHSKNSNLTEILRKNRESLNGLEVATRSLQAENESLRDKVQEGVSQCAAKDREIEGLSRVKLENTSVVRKLEEVSSSLNALQQEKISLEAEVAKLSESLAKVELDGVEKDEIILEIERSNALLQRELDTVRECRGSQDELTKKLIEEQISIGLHKLTTKNKAYKEELKRLLSVNAIEAQKSSQFLSRIALLEEKLAAAETKEAEYEEESDKYRQTIESYKSKCESLKQELNRLRNLHLTQIAASSDLENTICSLKEKNKDLSERCDELRLVFCARVEKIESSSDLQNDLREKNLMLQEEFDFLRRQNEEQEELIAALKGESSTAEDKLRNLKEITDVRASDITSLLVKLGNIPSSQACNIYEDGKEGLAASIGDLVEKSMVLERKVGELVDIRTSLDNEINGLQKREAELNGKLNDLDKKTGELVGKLADEHSSNDLLREKFEQSERKLGEVARQLDLSMTKNSDLQTEVEASAKSFSILGKERDELEASLKQSNDKAECIEKRAAGYEMTLLELFDQIGFASSANLMKPNLPVSQGTQSSLVERAKVAAQQLMRIADEVVSLKESVSALREQVGDWRASAVELRSKNSDLTEKLKKESESLQTALSRISQLSNDKDLIAMELSSGLDDHRTAKAEIVKLWKEASDLVKISLGPASVETGPPEAEHTVCPYGDYEAAAREMFRNITLLGAKVEMISKDRASVELRAVQMADTIVAQRSQIAGLEETIRLFCDNDGGLEISLQSKIETMDDENKSLRKENAALEREIAQLRIIHENSKACNQSISSLLAKLGLSFEPPFSSEDEDQEEIDDNIKALESNMVRLQQRLEEMRMESCIANQDNTTYSGKPTMECGDGDKGETPDSPPAVQFDENSRPHLNNQVEGVAIDTSSMQQESVTSISSEGEFCKQSQQYPGIVKPDQKPDPGELLAANRALRLENKVLKKVGKTNDEDARQLQQRLREENESLKNAIQRLTLQTTEHQDRIRQLAKRQAELVKRKQSTCHMCQAKENKDQWDSAVSASESPESTLVAAIEAATETPKDADGESRDDELQHTS